MDVLVAEQTELKKAVMVKVAASRCKTERHADVRSVYGRTAKEENVL